MEIDEKLYAFLQNSYIKQSLNLLKPHYEYQGFKCMKKRKYENTIFISKYNFGHAKVFDHKEQRNKFLIICRAKESEKQIAIFQKIMKNVLRNDIILNVIDSYYLDSDKIFYVLEMESINQLLETFQKKYLLNSKVIEPLKNTIFQYFKKTFDLFNDYADEDIKYLEFYVQQTEKNKIQIKLNLIDPNFEQQQDKHINYEEDQLLQEEKSFEVDESVFSENNLKEEEQSNEEQEEQSEEQEEEINLIKEKMTPKKYTKEEQSQEEDRQTLELVQEIESKDSMDIELPIDDQAVIRHKNCNLSSDLLNSLNQNTIQKNNPTKQSFSRHQQEKQFNEMSQENKFQTENSFTGEQIKLQFPNKQEDLQGYNVDNEDQDDLDGNSEIISQEQLILLPQRRSPVQNVQPQKQIKKTEGDDEDYDDLDGNSEIISEEQSIQKPQIIYISQKQIKKIDEYDDDNIQIQLKSKNEKFIKKREKYFVSINQIKNSVFMKIKKTEFAKNMQNNYSKVLNIHPLKIFEVIQDHPNYQNFEVISSNEQVFILKANKRNQVVQIEGYLFSNIDQAQKLADKYECIIKNNNEIHSTFLNFETIAVTQQQVYVLLEKKFTDQLEIQNYNLYRLSGNCLLTALKNFISFCYELQMKYKIKITNINPKNIFCNKKNVNNGSNYSNQKHESAIKKEEEDDDKIYFTIDQLSFEDFEQQYIYIIESWVQCSLYSFNFSYRNIKDLRISTQNLIQEFFQRISEQQDLQQTFTKIQVVFNNFISMQKYCQSRDQNEKIQLSKKDINKIQITISSQNIHQQGAIKQILDLYKNNPSIKITGLKLNSYNLKNFLHFEIQNIFTKNILVENQNNAQQVLEIKNIFQNYQSMKEEVYEKLAEFIKNQLQASLTLTIINQQYLNEINNQIINADEFTEDQQKQIKNKNFTILELQISNLNDIYKLKMLIFEDSMLYLVGDGPFLLLKYEDYKEFEYLIKVIVFLQYYKNIFGLDYLHKYQIYKSINLETWISQELNDLQQITLINKETSYLFNLQTFKQINQLNIEFYQAGVDDKFTFSNMINQIEKTNINTLQLTYNQIMFRNYKIANINIFRKLKNLVVLSVKKNEVDTGSDYDDEEQQLYQYENKDLNF